MIFLQNSELLQNFYKKDSAVVVIFMFYHKFKKKNLQIGSLFTNIFIQNFSGGLDFHF